MLTLSIVLISLVLLSAFFSSSETGMMSVNRYRLHHMARKGSRSAQRVAKLLERPDRLLGVILIGNTFANILASSVATAIAIEYFGDLGILIATVCLTLVILIFAEMAPKTLAVLYSQRLSFIVSVPLAVLLKLLYPIVWLANIVANGFLRLFGVRVKQKHIAERLNAEELRTVLHESTETISDRHKDMLLGVLDLLTVKVDDVMLPRNEIEGIDLNDPWTKIIKQITRSPHVRFPVYRDNVDNMAGILHVQDALKYMHNNNFNEATIQKMLHEPYFIPEGTALNVQLHNFRNNRRRSALVVDEYGDIIGLVTLEDILEEIVGELDTDVASVNRDIMPQKDGSYLVNGSVSIRELNKFMQWTLPINGPKTLSGLIIENLETIPDAVVCLKLESYQIEVKKIERNRIVRVRIDLNN